MLVEGKRKSLKTNILNGIKMEGGDFMEEESLRDQLKVVECSIIKETLSRSFGNKSFASKMLGVSRGTLNRRIKLYEIDINDYKFN